MPSMQLTFLEEKDCLVILIDESPWKKVSKSLFQKEVASLQQCANVDELQKSFSLLENRLAKRYAIRLLSRQSLFFKSLQEKLLRKNFSKQAIEHALEFCQKLGAIKEESQSERFILNKMKKGYSLRFAKRALQEKTDITPPHVVSDEAAVIRSLLKKKFSLISWNNPKASLKVLQFFARRGFPIDMILEEIKVFSQNCLEKSDEKNRDSD
jgi:SOS response regulatory protein OraA/RecX